MKLQDEITALREEVARLRERVAVLEARPIPGVFQNPYPGKGPVVSPSPSVFPWPGPATAKQREDAQRLQDMIDKAGRSAVADTPCVPLWN